MFLLNIRPGILFRISSFNIALTEGQMKSVAKTLHPQPLFQLHCFDNITPIVNHYSNQSRMVEFPAREGILQGFSYVPPSVVLGKVAGLKTGTFHLQVFHERYCHTHVWLAGPAGPRQWSAQT